MKYTFLLFLSLLVVPSTAAAQQIPGGFRGAFVEGHVIGTSGPLAGAKIDVVGAKVTKTSVKSGNEYGTGFAMSAANGNFAVGVGASNLCVNKQLPINGKYFVFVSKRGYLPQQKLVDFGGHDDIGGMQFMLETSNESIQGTIVDGNGKPLPYAFAWLTKNMFAMFSSGGAPKGHVAPLVSELPMVRSDQNGKFTIAVSPGDYVVMAEKAGYQLATKNVNPLAQQYAAQMAGVAQMGGAKVQKELGALTQPQPGVFVHMGQSAGFVNVGSLALVKDRATPAPSILRATMTRKANRYLVTLAGQARPGPGNVLFFTSRYFGKSLSNAETLDIVRANTPLSTGKIDPIKSGVKTFNFAVYGYPGAVGCQHRPGQPVSQYSCADKVYSFTDATVTPGKLYYYYVFEGPAVRIAPGGKINLFQLGAPYSNALPLVTI